MFINWSSDLYCYTALRNALWFKNMNECDFKYWFNHFTDIFRKVYGKGFERKGFTKVIYFTYYAWIYLPSWRLTPRHHYFADWVHELEGMRFALSWEICTVKGFKFHKYTYCKESMYIMLLLRLESGSFVKGSGVVFLWIYCW